MTLSTSTYDSVPLGMNLAVPPHEINDRQARYIQDGILTEPGIVKRRGPVEAITTSGLSSSRNKAVGIVQTTLLDGTIRVMVLTDAGSGTNACFVFSETGTQLGTFDWPYALSTSTAYPIINSSPNLGGGLWISTTTNYDPSNTSSLALWRGAYGAQNTTGTIVTTRGSTTVTGTATGWDTTGSLTGMFLFDNLGNYIGTVASVASATTLTLEQPATFTQTPTAAYSLRPVRGYVKRVSTGTISVAFGGTAVAGVGTKFLSQGMTSSTSLYRARDLTFIGTITGTVSSDTTVTLASGAAVAMDNEPYYAINSAEASSVQITSGTGLFTTTTEKGQTVNTRTLQNTPGYLTTTHVYRQWYANLGVTAQPNGEPVSRIWFSEFRNGETVDFSEKTGNFIPIPSTGGAATPIRAIVSTRGGLLVLKENETWLVTGTDPTNFATRKLADDGAPSGMSALPWAGGCVWAGKHGVYWFDGASLKNITDANLGEYYTTAVKSFPWNTKRMWSTIFRNHLLIFIEQVTPTVAVIKGSVAAVPSKLCLCINLASNALTVFYNVEHRGAIILPKLNTPWYIVNENSTGKFFIANGGSLFDSEAKDSIICDGNTVAGPDFYLETKRFSLGDPLRKKLYKMYLAHYFLAGDTMKMDIVTGLNEAGTTNSSAWPASGTTWTFTASNYNSWDALSTAYANWDNLGSVVWLKKKVRFLKRDQLIGFRLYQNSNNVTELRVGPFQIGFKPLRAGRL